MHGTKKYIEKMFNRDGKKQVKEDEDIKKRIKVKFTQLYYYIEQ